MNMNLRLERKTYVVTSVMRVVSVVWDIFNPLVTNYIFKTVVDFKINHENNFF